MVMVVVTMMEMMMVVTVMTMSDQWPPCQERG